MTYRDRVQDIIRDIDKLYDRIGGLRDFADTNEKAVYNDSRGILGTLARQWRRFDDNLPDDRGTMPVQWSKP